MSLFEVLQRHCLECYDVTVSPILSDSTVVSFVISDSTALATVENGTWRSTKTGKSEHVDIDAILIYNNEGEHYQNQQVIVLPKGKYLKRVGQYSYISNSNIVSVVSIVQIQ